MLRIVDTHWHEPGFRSRDGYLQVIEDERGGAKAQKRTILKASMVLWPWADNFPSVPKARDLASDYQPQTYCLRPEGSSLIAVSP